MHMLNCRNQAVMRGFELVEEDMTFTVAMALEEFDGGGDLFANRETIRRKHIYLETCRGLYNVEEGSCPIMRVISDVCSAKVDSHLY